MTVQFLYFEGCPSWKKALEELKAVMEELGIEEEIMMVEIKSDEDAKKYRFLGSPSIRVDGKDIEEGVDSARDYRMGCRVYRHGLVLQGWPPKEMIKDAMKGN